MGERFTRRTFLKAGALGSALAAVGATGLLEKPLLETAHAKQSTPEEQIRYAVHQGHCGGNCSLKCTVRDGHLCNIEPNDNFEDPRYSVLCLKGLSEVQHVYAADRIKTPMKRVGERGSDEFEAISWDEAFDIIKEKLLPIREKYGNDSVFVSQTAEGRMSYLAALLGAVADGESGIDTGIPNGFDQVFGPIFGCSTNEIRDWASAKNLIIVGSNVLESALPQSRAFFEAKEAGCHIVTVDPRFSTTASKSHEWVPIVPGTDAALFMGMISVIIDNGWTDEQFMLANTNFPFLVDKETGMMMREHEPVEVLGIPGIVGEMADDNTFYVFDRAVGGPVSYLEAQDPQLEGEFEIEGKRYATAYTLLKENQKRYAVEWASEKTGIPVETIEYLARIYAVDAPSTIALGWGGNDKYSNADICGHAAGILAALTGGVGKPGAAVGVCADGLSDYTGLMGLTPFVSYALPEEYAAATVEYSTAYVSTYGINFKACICIGDAPQMHFANMNQTYQWLGGLEFIVYCDIFYSDTASYADVILPVCTRFEQREEIGKLRCFFNHLRLEQKVLDPLFDSRTDYEIQYEFAKMVGLEHLLPPTLEELTKIEISTIFDEGLIGATVDTFREHGWVLPVSGIEKPRLGFTDSIFFTTSGRMHPYTDYMAPYNQAVPNYEDPSEVFQDSELAKKYPMQLMSVRTRYHVHSQFCNAEWIRPFYDGEIEMNPEDMQARGLGAGDVVRVYNDRGEIKAVVSENNAMRPGTANIYEGTWGKFMKKGNLQMLTNDAYPERGLALPYGPVIPFNDTLVEIEKA